MKRVLAICAVSAFLFAACGDDDYYADVKAMNYNSKGVSEYGFHKNSGFSVRCVKD